jgi:hypothetical protein
VKSQKCWAHRHVNRNEDDVIASSEQQVDEKTTDDSPVDDSGKADL